MLYQIGTLVISGLILLFSSIVGAFVAHRGNGHLLWVAAAIALPLAVFGWLSVAQGRDVGGFGGVGYVLRGYLLSLVGLLVGLAACVDALVRARRARQFAWFAALLALGALPLVASLVVFDVTFAWLAQQQGGEPIVFQGERLALQLLPIGLVILIVYGIRLALGARRWG